MNNREHYKLISKIIRMTIVAKLDLALIATNEEDSPAAAMENGLCNIYNDNRTEDWDYTCSLVEFNGLAYNTFNKPDDITIDNPIINALLDDMVLVGWIRYGDNSLIPVTLLVGEKSYPTGTCMAINLIKRAQAIDTDTNRTPPVNTHHYPTFKRVPIKVEPVAKPSHNRLSNILDEHTAGKIIDAILRYLSMGPSRKEEWLSKYLSDVDLSALDLFTTWLQQYTGGIIVKGIIPSIPIWDGWDIKAIEDAGSDIKAAYISLRPLVAYLKISILSKKEKVQISTLSGVKGEPK